ncbi:secretin N-terminal domain-containing protein [Piscinibacter sp. HJYY11]|uniref:secretin N-terminal domain-containing protein n=1 Tax=Piscinibacter sp. HJYY11 TaxID=2801333 RepID=UPI00191F5FC9|nr:secretin N-terminal domain-containing protein [Piscinibacter sp. HJYY11]MBL0726173.1 general secretion pathway protein GspD [Piscinibacter sp. HJYY11]
MRRWLVPVMVLTLLAACAPGREFVRNGQQMIEQGRLEEGLAQMEKGLLAEPENREYRMLVIRQRDVEVGKLLARADQQRAADRLDDAAALYRRVLGIDAQNSRAKQGLDAVDTARRHAQRLDEAQALIAQGKHDDAEQRVRRVLAENPAHARAQSLKQHLDQLPGRQGADASSPPVLKSNLRKPVSLDFRDANLKAVFDALARTTGINFVFDREVRPDIKVTLSISNIGIDDVISVLTLTNQLERKVLNENTVLIYPNTPAKQKDYQDLAVKTFYLSNVEAKTMFTLLKTVLKTRDMFADEKLNTITIRDSADAVRLAEKVIAAQDIAEPEVLLDVEVLEVKRSQLHELGLEPPGKFTLLNIVRNPATVVTSATGSTIVNDNTLTTTQLTLDKLRNVQGSSIGIDSPSLNLRAETGDTNILANPRIRVKNREKARIMIGDRVPVITTTSTANVGVSESVSYLDVGLKLEVEPNVFLDNEVGVKVNLEVSNIVREVKSRSGSLTYQIGTRLATTALRLKDGETQALAGLISDEDRKSAAGVPGMVDLPVLGRILSSERNDRSKTEIVLLITPRVVRNLAQVPLERQEHAGGTETQVGAARLRLQGTGRMALAPGRGGVVRNAAAPAPEDAPQEAAEPPPPVAPPAAPQRANNRE